MNSNRSVRPSSVAIIHSIVRCSSCSFTHHSDGGRQNDRHLIIGKCAYFRFNFNTLTPKKTLSLKFRLIHMQMHAKFMKEKEGKFLGELHELLNEKI